MSAINQHIITGDGSISLFDPNFDECYHSHGGALTEAQNLYLGGSKFKERLAEDPTQAISVADIGLGLGYNACATLTSWLDHPNPPPLYLTSFELNRNLVTQLFSKQAIWQSNWPKNWLDLFGPGTTTSEGEVITTHGTHPITGAGYTWSILLGAITADSLAHKLASCTPCIPKFDFIWQDAFSPSKNPDLWSKSWFDALARTSHAQATLMTYSVARVVKDALENSGWHYQKIKASGNSKKHWLKATKSDGV